MIVIPVTHTGNLRRQVALLLAIAMLVVALPSRAANLMVTANPDMTFTPETVTIHQGDSITFVNAGGVHNVHADNNRFICAINCTTNNAPSSELWSATVRFNQVGTLGYYCDAHGDLTGGMRGTIIVLDRIFVDGFDTLGARSANR